MQFVEPPGPRRAFQVVPFPARREGSGGSEGRGDPVAAVAAATALDPDRRR
jgi:hypothetical protein